MRKIRVGKIIIFSLIGVLAVIFFVVGYIKRDNAFYDDLIKKEHLTTPELVYKWETTHYVHPYSHAVVRYLSPRYLIEKQPWLWCDESAIVMATLDHRLGYKTRLIDLYGFDNISHHTILQVFQNNKWINYDFSTKFYNKAIRASSDSLKIKLKVARVKPYPKLYNAVVNSNYFLKRLAIKLRGIKEPAY